MIKFTGGVLKNKNFKLCTTYSAVLGSKGRNDDTRSSLASSRGIIIPFQLLTSFHSSCPDFLRGCTAKAREHSTDILREQLTPLMHVTCTHHLGLQVTPPAMAENPDCPFVLWQPPSPQGLLLREVQGTHNPSSPSASLWLFWSPHPRA